MYGGTLNLDYTAIRKHIEESSPHAVIMIGCDSVRKQPPSGQASAVYSTVVCVRKASGEKGSVMYHGCKVFGASVRLRDYGKVIRSGKLANLKLRLLQEVTYALEAYQAVHESIGDRRFEIHLDIASDPEWESHVAMSEARGYVLGVSGKEPDFKPNALAASFAADAHAHGLL